MISSAISDFLCFESPCLAALFLSLCWPAPPILAFLTTKFRGGGALTVFLDSFASNNSISLMLAPYKKGQTVANCLPQTPAFYSSSHNSPKVVVKTIYHYSYILSLDFTSR